MRDEVRRQEIDTILHGPISTKYDGEKLTIRRETNDESLQHDRYACAMKRVKDGRGLFVAQLVTVGHVPLEVSKLCYYVLHVPQR